MGTNYYNKRNIKNIIGSSNNNDDKDIKSYVIMVSLIMITIIMKMRNTRIANQIQK